jgi:hypothetical protein
LAMRSGIQITRSGTTLGSRLGDPVGDRIGGTVCCIIVEV